LLLLARGHIHASMHTASDFCTIEKGSKPSVYDDVGAVLQFHTLCIAAA
jgi:hypothetical protein